MVVGDYEVLGEVYWCYGVEYVEKIYVDFYVS